MLNCLVISSLLDPTVSLSTQLSKALGRCSLMWETKLHTHSKEQAKSYSYILIFILRFANRKWKYSAGCNLKCIYSEVRRGSPEVWWYNSYSAAAGANFCVCCFEIYFDTLTWDYFALGSIIITITVIINIIIIVGRYSAVRIATRFGLDGPRIESRWERVFLHLSNPVLGPTQPLIKWVPGLSRGWIGRVVALTTNPI